MPGVPETEEFPFDVWTRLHSRYWRHPSATLVRLGAPAGLQALRQAITRYLATFHGLTCDWRQVIVTTGAQQALDLMIQLLQIGRAHDCTQSLIRITNATLCII